MYEIVVNYGLSGRVFLKQRRQVGIQCIVQECHVDSGNGSVVACQQRGREVALETTGGVVVFVSLPPWIVGDSDLGSVMPARPKDPFHAGKDRRRVIFLVYCVIEDPNSQEDNQTQAAGTNVTCLLRFLHATS